MTTRRTFIKTLAALPPALALPTMYAADAATSRCALVLGNEAYRDVPLRNPAHDARAVAALLAEARFSVDTRLNATRLEMMSAVERLVGVAKRPDTRLVVFYYAGHGAQLDWRNYLLPVDAVVERQEHLRQRGFDLNLLLGQLIGARDKTFIVILDACRNNPFGRSYRPEQPGLSQFDAPVGSLIAYATSPGKVASDGDGQNGLYTENLVRELARRGTRIEDALKRVRLNVRLASHGEQIPWETTSLESDIFLFEEGQAKLSESEQEKWLEADVAEWGRIKLSRRADDWVGYLRRFPNGRFAEIAQMRLSRLLAESEKSSSATAAAPSSAAALFPSEAETAAIDIHSGTAVPTLFAPSQNPYSAGRYPLGRLYSVGDRAVFRQTDILTGLEEGRPVLRVTRVDVDKDWVEFNDGAVISDLMGNFLKSGSFEFSAPVLWAPAEFQIGKKWSSASQRTKDGVTSRLTYEMRITHRENVKVPAGTFDAFRIEGDGWNTTFRTRIEVKLWLVPGLNFAVKREVFSHNRWGGYQQAERLELLAVRQRTVDTTCADPESAQRTLVIRGNCA